MKVTGVIPARYNSSRFKGKPLAEIMSKPMIWWVYRAVSGAKKLDCVYVATDSDEIADTCSKYEIPYIMTSSQHRTGTERIHEVSTKIESDIYVCINGDEPLIEPETIDAVVPESADSFFAANLMTKIKSPAEALDSTNIKVVTDSNGYALFMSRSMIPHPKGSIDFEYFKHLGVIAYTKEALDFFVNTPRGKNEEAEDINELRFIENSKKLKMIEVNAASLSVDTPKDLEHVRAVIEKKVKRGEIIL